MAVDVKRKKGETFEAFVRRFNKRLMQSGTLLQFKKIRYHQKEKSRNLAKNSALVRLKKRAEIEYLKKTGRITEEQLKPKRGGRR